MELGWPTNYRTILWVTCVGTTLSTERIEWFRPNAERSIASFKGFHSDHSRRIDAGHFARLEMACPILFARSTVCCTDCTGWQSSHSHRSLENPIFRKHFIYPNQRPDPSTEPTVFNSYKSHESHIYPEWIGKIHRRSFCRWSTTSVRI